MKTCPFCAEEIQDAAIVCKHCRRDLLQAEPDAIAADTETAANTEPDAIAATIATAVKPEVGVGSSYGNGWRQLWKHFLMLFIIGFVVFLISLPKDIVRRVAQEIGGIAGAVLFILSLPYSFLLLGPLVYGSSFVYLKAARDEPPDFKDVFAGFKDYWNVVLASLLVTVIVFSGILLFVVPGIIFWSKLAFTPYLVVDRRMRATDAIRESWRMTTGHAGKVFLIALLAVPIGLAGLICFGVGIIISIMWISLAFASLYLAVSTSGEAVVPLEEPAT